MNDKPSWLTAAQVEERYGFDPASFTEPGTPKHVTSMLLPARDASGMAFVRFYLEDACRDHRR